MTILLGSDPEIFVLRGNGELFYAFEFLDPEKKDKTEDGNSVYPDGFQAEFTVTPSPFAIDTVKSIRLGLAKLIELARKKDAKARLSSDTVVPVDLKVMQTLPLEFCEFGCMPSYNIYQIAGMGGSGPDTPWRFGGGHIHIGDEDLVQKTDADYYKVVRNLDAILGMVGVSLAENLDNPIRRRYYGLPGEHRRPPHGLEYRVLSNFWIFSPTLAIIILQLARNVVTFTKVDDHVAWKAEEEEITEAIITGNVDLARKILSRNKNILDNLSSSLNFFQPIEKSIPGIRNIETNWGI